jgi:DNA-binding GntR family transcriptional regulator
MAEPEWRRVAEELRQRIRDRRDLTVRQHRGRSAPSLPNYEDLQEQHDTSYGTLRTALILLESEGWIDRVGGVGLLIREDHPA